MRVRWLRRALRNLESIYEYMEKDNPEAAQKVIMKIRVGVNKLADFPLMGRLGRVESTRELVIGNTPYIVIYRVKSNAVEILRVLHSARQFPES
ncbi:toxin Y4kP [Hydrococcus rivularis NIES-593]|uniref:Toxin Y4kP n=1 Tax=Hydrococcus rivularis NIES-593 TaxID=1921803 RepID=A0A1U7HG50_9CYAN|nr:type II toxin-antitoxin system mRNA interferase toxin, RelE/StbE family [Hydrococcus rivularis]OKH22563.1 toxin Y4kP [Hydrococcus rivularis NIES-593]